jgi:RNA polymerase sigma factor (sigma-70 family)
LSIDPQIPPGETRNDLRQFLQESTPLLLGIVRSYVVRTGLAHGEAVQLVALEVLQEAVLEALSHADRLTTSGQPRAWFLAIAANVIKRKKASLARSSQREVLFSALTNHAEATMDEGAFFDLFAAHTQPGPEAEVEADEEATALLSLVSADDQEVLRLALINDLDSSMLAKRLHITSGAARVRLHRAINRLRIAWNKHEQPGKEGRSDA